MLNRPIKPDEIPEHKATQIPDEVFNVFNELILENIGTGRAATILQNDVLDRLKDVGIDRREAFKKGWLDVEGAYRREGWVVMYDKPGYNEDYPATFTFKMPSKK